MGEKDITEKTLENYDDVFADIINVLLFQGRQIVEEDALVDALPRSQYKVADSIHEMERDVAKYWKWADSDCIAGLGKSDQRRQ